MEYVTEPLGLAFMQRALVASLLVALAGGVIGTFVVLKGLAFIGDALSHAAFAGVATAFVLGGSIYLGSIVAGVVTALAIGFVSRRGGISFDTAIGILFVGAFAFYLSDLAVARQRFVVKSFTNKAWGLPLYFGAQLVLAWTVRP